MSRARASAPPLYGASGSGSRSRLPSYGAFLATPPSSGSSHAGASALAGSSTSSYPFWSNGSATSSAFSPATASGANYAPPIRSGGGSSSLSPPAPGPGVGSGQARPAGTRSTSAASALLAGENPFSLRSSASTSTYENGLRERSRAAPAFPAYTSPLGTGSGLLGLGAGEGGGAPGSSGVEAGGGPGAPTWARFEENNAVSFTWVLPELALLRDEVEHTAAPHDPFASATAAAAGAGAGAGGRDGSTSPTTARRTLEESLVRSVSAGAGKSEVWTTQPLFGEGKWKLELVRTLRNLPEAADGAGREEPAAAEKSKGTQTRRTMTVLSVYLSEWQADAQDDSHLDS